MMMLTIKLPLLTPAFAFGLAEAFLAAAFLAAARTEAFVLAVEAFAFAWAANDFFFGEALVLGCRDRALGFAAGFALGG